MQPAPARENLLAGLVERVTFHIEDSGFCVLRVEARGQRDLITVVGHAAPIGVGEFMRASTHGVQFPPISSSTSWLNEFRTCEHVYRILRNTMPSTAIANLSAQGSAS